MDETASVVENNQTPSQIQGVGEVDELTGVLSQEIEARNSGNITLDCFSPALSSYLELQQLRSAENSALGTADGGHGSSASASAGESSTSASSTLQPSTASPCPLRPTNVQPPAAEKSTLTGALRPNPEATMAEEWWKSVDFDKPGPGCGDPSTPRRRLTPLSPRQSLEAAQRVTSPVASTCYYIVEDFVIPENAAENPNSEGQGGSGIRKKLPKAVVDLFSRKPRQNAELNVSSNGGGRAITMAEVTRLADMKPKDVHFVGDAVLRFFMVNDIVLEPWKLSVGYHDERYNMTREHLLIYWYNEATEQICLAPEHIKYIQTSSAGGEFLLWQGNENMDGFGVFMPEGQLPYPLAQ